MVCTNKLCDFRAGHIIIQKTKNKKKPKPLSWFSVMSPQMGANESKGSKLLQMDPNKHKWIQIDPENIEIWKSVQELPISPNYTFTLLKIFTQTAVSKYWSFYE